MRLATNLFYIILISLFLFVGCAGLGAGAKSVVSEGNRTEINLFSGNFNDNHLFSDNRATITKTDTRTTNIDNDNTVGSLMIAVVVGIFAIVIGKFLGRTGGF